MRGILCHCPLANTSAPDARGGRWHRWGLGGGNVYWVSSPSMILYFAGESFDQITREEGADTLKSYAYEPAARRLLEEGRKTRFFLDSGAFTAFSKGRQVDIHAYADFIKKYRDRITVASNLDVIGSHEGTLKNQHKLESLGCNVLPVFHHGEPWELLEWYVKNYNYLALGGLVPIAKDRKAMALFLDKAFSIIQDKTRIHGFGVNATWAWRTYPFYSVDATSWLSGPRHRTLTEFNGTKLKQTRKNDTGNVSTSRVRAATAHYKDLARWNLNAYREAADLATRIWKARGFTFPSCQFPIKK